MVLKLPDPFNYGQDLSCYSDLAPNMDEVSGVDVFAQDLVHRLETPRGAVDDDPDYGTDAREDVGASLTQAELEQRPAKYAAELSKDDRIDHVDVLIQQETVTTISVAFIVTPLVGPTFRLTADITQAFILVTSVTADNG